MKKKLIFLVLIFIASKNFSQEKEKNSNPIIYIDLSLNGVSSGKVGGNNFFAALNYQYKKSLFTYRYTITSDIYKSELDRYYLLMLPFSSLSVFFSNQINQREHAFLYGRKRVKDAFSYSFSIGLSINEYYNIIYEKIGNNSYEAIADNYEKTSLGIPLEFQIHWIKPKKKIRKFLDLFPYGKPTGFGGAMGIKIFGNLSQKSYIGIGLTYGFGYYKKY